VVREDGQFLSQRNYPKLALARALIEADGSLVLSATGRPNLHVAVPEGGERRSVTVWNDTFDAVTADQRAAEWFTDFLGTPCRLVFMDENSCRPVARKYGREGDVVSFADAAPLLLACDVSLADLNRRLAHPLEMSRFRPNVTVDGHVPWEEDDWKMIRLGDVPFEVTHRCARCVVTTIDQESGEKSSDGEPLKTLARFRRDADGVYFGQNLLPRGVGVIQLGDAVEVIG
jgi:uncharacterized protein YcbX